MTQTSSPTHGSLQATPSSIHIRNDSSLVEAQKVIKICQAIEQVKLTPKKFMMAFLKHSDVLVRIRRKLWGAPTGWDGTLEVIKAARDLICKTPAGRMYWKSFILSEAQQCIEKEGCFRDAIATGFYHPPKDIGPEFFEDSAKQSRSKLMRESMPFFYSLLMYKLTGTSNKTTGPNLPSEEDDCLSDASSDSESEESSSYSPAKRNKRCHSVRFLPH
ncbi:hypothetical protein PtA15_5A170 [Puccinia triticina]|uniref:Uncharacterized protein n=1 Tax=Puccinia triticina TaxID=208348 RepID=A0ABY7CPA7_9BASI|nr:uncharacterized protein PtA15_5A170 [Puccinia triticina]WAQ84597.1 hypothetical protein PtA15_5A170 [Puccinia triticina]